ncbi:MAG: dihydrodipicolinate reductase C-terminal domain-containing protein [Rectinemataceae bacterium]|jgi:4-hydroxy-tetrahydrodipicolinate reductase
MRIGIFGRGKLGSAVSALASRERDIEVSWFIDVGEKPGKKVDAVLDASAAEAVGEHLAWSLETGTNLVIGATGWDRSLLDPEKIKRAGTGVLVSPNFSLSVAFLRRAALALGRFAAIEAGSSLAIVERHHAAKADAPSGTAKLLADALVQGCPRYTGWNQGRAEEGRINIASLRAGAEVGYHEIRFETGADTILLSHEADSREIFAKGALVALRWMHGRSGLFTFDDLAADIIDPLFRA